MVRRRTSPKRQRPLRPLPVELRTETGPDGYEYHVRPVAASRATKTYRCPGCDHEIRSGTAHVVVWPAQLGDTAMEDRRHWHSPCWRHRSTRAPTRKWS